MKKIYYLIILLSTSLFSQTITVDDSGYTPSDLVTLLLGNSCTEVSNINVSSTQSVAYFNQNGSSFPIAEGIIIRNGQASFTQGTYTDSNLSSQINTNSDTFLQTISNNSGQTAGITDVAFLEFDFIPLSNNFSFNFLFASNEYGQYQCGFSDVFAFELINIGTGTSTNLAVIPGTSTPVTVKDIRDNVNNPACSSSNPNFFDIYNVTNPAASTLNMRGHTIVMNASSAVVPNTPYRIRLVIGDYNDSGFDSAVFLDAGSFETTLDLGPDQTICSGDMYTLDTGLDLTYNYVWYLNGTPIAGETAPSLDVTQQGTYTVEATKGTCLITDTVVFTNLSVNNPQNIEVCDTGAATYSFDLTNNDEAFLGINNADYDIFYYNSITNVATNNPIPSGNLTNYVSPSGATIFIKIFNLNTGNFCNAIYTFNLIVTDPVVSTQPNDVELCEVNGGTSFVLNSLDSEVLNGENPLDYTITYYSSIGDATSGTSPITNITIPNGTTSITLGIRMQSNTNPSCFDVNSVVIIINPLPDVDSIPDVIECSNYTLPPISPGTYYSGPNGTGTQLNAGDIIDEGGTYYIFIGPDSNGCVNESSFLITLIDEYVPQLDNCGIFIVPSPPSNIGDFYTEPDGPNGTGVIIPIGTEFVNTSQTLLVETIYYYAEVNGTLCRDERFDINIHPMPLLDNPDDVTTCNSYTLPALINGQYYLNSGGPSVAGQVQLFENDVIDVNGPFFPGTYYIYNELEYTDVNGFSAFCIDENTITFNLVDTSQFTTITSCGSYMLPAISYGNYYTAPMGGGTLIDPSIPITTSQIVYYYTDTTILPNCTNNLNYNITINPLPIVDTVTSDTYCGEFILPNLINGTYYLLPGGPTSPGQVQLNPGNIIDLSGINLSPGTYYIFNGPNANGCTNETSFTINLNAFPPIDGVLDRTECSPYTISTPTNGTIYTEIGGPNGSGTVVQPSDSFDYTSTFYIYNIDSSTGCEIDRPFTVTYSGNNLPDYQDVFVCEFENYTLPALTHQAPTPFNYSIGYYYDTNGVNPVPNGTVFNTPNTQTTIYVYASNGDRIICNEEDSFVITVSETPILPNYSNIVRCGSYTLPPLPIGNYNVNYYNQPNGVGLISTSNYTYNTPGTYDVYVYATSIENTNCNDERFFQITIYPLLDLNIQGGIICVNPITGITEQPLLLNSGLNPADFTVEWYLNGILMGTGTTYLATEAGTYDVVTIKVSAENPPDCNYNPTSVLVEQSSSAIASVSISEPFDNVAVITVNIENGIGEYIYQLDNGAFQASNQFYNVSSGEHIITVRDIFGYCGDFILTATVIKYPKYFTPNGDGANETWNIFDLAIDHPESIISIFDRYGKLIKQISPIGTGWDGTFNGKELPSTDYWFNVNYNYEGQEKIFRAHFSLIR